MWVVLIGAFKKKISDAHTPDFRPNVLCEIKPDTGK